MFWWVFVVAVMFPAISDGSGRSEVVYNGAYQPLTDTLNGSIVHVASNDYAPSDGFCIGRPLAILAFALVVIAAVVEAVLMRRQTQGFITVAVPLFAGLAIWQVVPDPCGIRSSVTVSSLAIILLAIAAREIWARYYTPSLSSLPPS